MPPKLKKVTTSWQACESCGIILSAKDLKIHLNNSCEIDNERALIHGYIKDAILVTSIEEFPTDCINHLPPIERDYHVYVSESAMQLCDLVIGGHALVKYANGSAVRSVWPLYERSLSSVVMTDEGMISLGIQPGTRLSVEKPPALPLPAAAVLILPLSGAGNVSAPAVSALSKIFLGKVILEGNQLCARHFGQRLHFRIIKCVGEDNRLCSNGDGMMVEGIRKMHVSDQFSPYLVNVRTKFQLAEAGSAQTRKRLSLMSVGGLDDIIKKLKEFLDMVWNPDYSNIGVKRGHGCLISGPPGTGKTLLVKALASETSANFIEILGSEVYSKYVGEAEGRLRSYFSAAKQNAVPSLVFFDEVDALCSMDGSHQQEQRISAALLTLLDDLQGSSVAVIAATSRPGVLDPRLRRPGRLELELELPVPSAPQRLDILRKIVGMWGVDVGEGVLDMVARCTHGHVGADLAGVCAHAQAAAVARGGGIVVLEEDWVEACAHVKPSAMREVIIEVPNVRWSDIGGQNELKLRLRQAVEWPLKHPEAFVRLGISPPKGLLMFGPPGCSKTMVARAIATESGLNFISIKGPELFSKWVGESERAVREVFRRARQVAPAVVFFDELDALGGERASSREGSGGSSVQERVLAQLLTEMDGITPLSNVTIVAATNRPDRIDKALLRPGRLDQIVYVPLPDHSTRMEILSKQFSKSCFSHEVVLEKVVEQTRGYSGAEVLAVCQEAGLNALEEDIHAACIEKHHVDKALQHVKPRTPQYLLELYDKYQKKKF